VDHPQVVWGHRHGTHSLVGISESDGVRTSVTGVVLYLVAAVCYPGGVVGQKLALRHASAVQVTTFGCFTGTAACLPFAGQLLSQLGAPYNPRGHNLRRSRPSRHGDQRARAMATGTVNLVREDY
jgi:drug/metabolite transporter (DMT)-like permease